jgi:hypothetical protein
MVTPHYVISLFSEFLVEPLNYNYKMTEYDHILVDIEFIKLSKSKLKIIDCTVNIQFYIISLF